MKSEFLYLSQRYQAALQAHLKHGRQASLQPARGLGSEALAAGLQTLDLAKVHEHILVTNVLPGRSERQRAALIKQAGTFFAVAIDVVEETQQGEKEVTVRLKEFVKTLSQRTVELAASNLELSLEIIQRKAAEEALKKSERHHSQLLEQSEVLQEQLRGLSRQILSAQEDERKKISRELHDVIAQTLTGINIRLASLKKDAALNARALERNIDLTQRLVQHSVDIVHRFARELRPAVLDDLGLIPALHSFMKSFTTQTGIRTQLTAFAGVESLEMSRRTALYRVAQEALTNVARHAQASQVQVSIEKEDGALTMRITDDGNGFVPQNLARGKKSKRLGLLGMRERVEMINGSFTLTSALGQGTTVQARIPFKRDMRGTRKNYRS